MENFGVFKSAFGDYWVGKIGLEVGGKIIFATFDEAIDRAKQLTDSIENTHELEDQTEEETELVDTDMHKWLVK